jgi:hypothetical protein
MTNNGKPFTEADFNIAVLSIGGTDETAARPTRFCKSVTFDSIELQYGHFIQDIGCLT